MSRFVYYPNGDRWVNVDHIVWFKLKPHGILTLGFVDGTVWETQDARFRSDLVRSLNYGTTAVIDDP